MKTLFYAEGKMVSRTYLLINEILNPENSTLSPQNSILNPETSNP